MRDLDNRKLPFARNRIDMVFKIFKKRSNLRDI